ncbi:aprataxin-like protein [Phlebotomus papatasi]|uniref:aprataxin-like protein n=1 Tax=Phlebotomus papatasi TaxID=29031 RepID=UPI002483D8F0|nr:aprataxin-like protein [Phlebotomus papatasi]
MSHWSQNLLKSMQDPQAILIKSELLTVIQDKYPKAKHHYLILPHQNIESIFQLKRCHLSLLDEMELMAKNTVEIIGGKLSDFKIGYHAQPSMKRLHLHTISNDFISSSLKTKKHWNSFNTDLFIPARKLYDMLENQGKIERYPAHVVNTLLSQDLQCNKCSYIAENMPNLKQHLLLHDK